MIGAAGLLLASAALLAPEPSPAEDAVKRVLVLHSFGPDYFHDLEGELRTALGQHSPERVEVFEVPLEFILDPTNHQRHMRMERDIARYFYVVPYGAYFIWGATAGMLVNLYEALAGGETSSRE